MPLTDRFGRQHTYLRVSVTDRCNLRCFYCMPRQGASWKPGAEILSFEEIHRICRIAVEEGVTKIRLTGGEPTVRQSLEELVEKLAALPGLKTLAMTTNGVLLTKKAQSLKRAGLQSVNISLDSLQRWRYSGITAQDRLNDVLQGIDIALEAGFSPVKLNVVVVAGVNDDEVLDFVEFVRNRPVNVRFIEFMPFPGNPWNEERCVPWQAMKRQLDARYDLLPLASETHATAVRSFRIEGCAGAVSFISPLSAEFCAGCNRLRLTADGMIKSCLLYSAELSVRDVLRNCASDSDVASLIRTALNQKRFAHFPANFLPEMANEPMANIGG